jgi:hypothetical protein
MRLLTFKKPFFAREGEYSQCLPIFGAKPITPSSH